MNYTEALNLNKQAKAIPTYRRAWKWLTAGSRSAALQAKLHARQLKSLEEVPLEDLARKFRLAAIPVADIVEEFPDSADFAKNFKYWRSAPAGNFVSNRPMKWYEPFLGMSFAQNTVDKVKPTDALLHELGHIATHDTGALPKEFFTRGPVDSSFSFLRRLLHPETSKLAIGERAADVLAFGRDGKLSRFAQLRHHPGYAGYLAGSRINAAAQGGMLGLHGYGTYLGGKWAYNKLKQPTQNTKSTRATGDAT